MTTYEDVESRARAAARLLGELERELVDGDDIVPPDHALGFNTEDLIEIDAAHRHEGRHGLRRGHGEFSVERRKETLAEVTIRRAQGGNARHSELVDEPPLYRPVRALTAPPR